VPAITYSYTQISQYLRCPRAYRYKYLDGWREKDSRAALIFGRCFEKALSAFLCNEDASAVLFKEWGNYRESDLDFGKGDDWERMLRQGVKLLERFAQDDRVRVSQPKQDLQAKLIRTLPNGDDFVAYLDGIGDLDGNRCILEWKTSRARYPEEPDGLVALDPQMICYSWMSGIQDVAMIVFVRKAVPEIQYFRAAITDAQRQDFGQMVEATVNQIEAGHFLPHTGIRFPQNGCVSCAHLGLCLNDKQLIDTNLIRRPGASDLDWLDELSD
jgi:hypothetical protein